SHSPQPCELDLREFNGKRPLELLGHSPFPKIGELPYFLTLPAYGFYWFLLTEEGEEPGEEVDVALPELHTLVMPKGWESLMGSRSGDFLEKQILPLYL